MWFGKLQFLYLENNKLEFLPGDLVQGNLELRKINFASNIIVFVGLEFSVKSCEGSDTFDISLMSERLRKLCFVGTIHAKLLSANKRIGEFEEIIKNLPGNFYPNFCNGFVFLNDTSKGRLLFKFKAGMTYYTMLPRSLMLITFVINVI